MRTGILVLLLGLWGCEERSSQLQNMEHALNEPGKRKQVSQGASDHGQPSSQSVGLGSGGFECGPKSLPVVMFDPLQNQMTYCDKGAWRPVDGRGAVAQHEAPKDHGEGDHQQASGHNTVSSEGHHDMGHGKPAHHSDEHEPKPHGNAKGHDMAGHGEPADSHGGGHGMKMAAHGKEAMPHGSKKEAAHGSHHESRMGHTWKDMKKTPAKKLKTSYTARRQSDTYWCRKSNDGFKCSMTEQSLSH